MPGLVRKLRVFATSQSVVVQPLAVRHQRVAQPIRIDYKSHSIGSLVRDLDSDEDASDVYIEAYGIVGLLSVSTSSFLIAITQRRKVAQIRGKAVYAVTDVAIIPLSSEDDAHQAISQARERVRKQSAAAGDHANAESDSSDYDEDNVLSDDDLYNSDDAAARRASHTPPRSPALEAKGHARKTSVAVDVIGRKGIYGRFADRWFSQRGWTVEKRRLEGMSAEVVPTLAVSDADWDVPLAADTPSVVLSSAHAEHEPPSEQKMVPMSSEKPDETHADSITSTLLPKLLRTTRMLFGSGNFFFSYECDITRSPATSTKQSRSLPLHQAVDPLYFWNRHIALPFINGHQDAFVLPLMQGFIAQCTFSVKKTPGDTPDSLMEVRTDVGDVLEDENAKDTGLEAADEQSFLLTLISRRSIRRAGLRYLRRGIDDDGEAANSVETEQILSSPTWGEHEKLHSVVQIRGSIPLYFSQSPYSFKPVPLLQRSEESNYAAMKTHFESIAARYGDVQVVSLVAKEGSEAIVGDEYQKLVGKLNDDGGVNGSSAGFEWWDFHEACRGMKFENVSQLMHILGEKLDQFGHTTVIDGQVVRQQSGALRTNCMDCLDRTNVVQSAYGRRALELQLKDLGIALDLQADKSTQWFNGLWADNGDAISKQYTSTAAMKGDYTRTRKRDYRGALNDIGLSVSRYFNNIVNDYFSQAAMDYLLGNVNVQVFEEFEADMMSGDPAMSMTKLRQNAIDNSASIVIEDKAEELLGGWTLLAPKEPNTLRTFPFHEIVLLLTPQAVYTCVFPPASPLEKPSSFTRVPLANIQTIHYGAYITSTLANAHISSTRNCGFVLTYTTLPLSVSPPSDTQASLESEESRTNARVPGPTPGSSGIQPTPAATTVSTTLQPQLSSLGNDVEVKQETKIQAYKALPSRSSTSLSTSAGVSEAELVQQICYQIAAATKSLAGASRSGGGETTGLEVEQRDVISLKDARKSTGLLEQLGYEIKKMVWA